MAEIVDNRMSNMTVGDVKCRTEVAVMSSAPSEGIMNGRRGKIENDGKKKSRRRKPKRKNPYSKTEIRGKKTIRKQTYEQPVAPYNSNQFLLEDHNDLKDFDAKLMEAANKSEEIPPRTGRIRDASFTSAESEEDYFYSSPEDEEEFLTKEFSNTYKDLHADALASMSKTELIQNVLSLEERLDTLQKRLAAERDPNSESVENSDADKLHFYQTEIAKLVLANQKLTSDNAKLREKIRGTRCSPPSTEDSESDSTSSSGSCRRNNDEHMTLDKPYNHLNGDLNKHEAGDGENT